MPVRILTFNISLTLWAWFMICPLIAQVSSEHEVRTIVLDAGHGGKDPGAIYNGVREKDITLAITKILGGMLERYLPDVQVIYTRTGDHFIPLHGRARIANENNADVFISIHCNYFRKNTHKHGSETYVMGLHKLEDNLLVAKRENEAVNYENDAGSHYDFDVNTPEGHIFLSMYQNASLDRSIRLADDIEQAFVKELKTSCRGVKQAGFYVLYRTSMPSVLIETGFLTNARDRKLLTSSDGQHKIATAIFDAILKYKGSVEGKDYSGVFPSHPSAPSSRKNPVAPKANTKEAGQEYMVQIAATTKQRPEFLRSIKDCKEERTQQFFKYRIGAFKTFEEANACRERMIKKGFKGAFIIARAYSIE